MATRIAFDKALDKLSELADAVIATGALTEMTGAEFAAYAATQIALASTEPRSEQAVRLSALKAAIYSAREQTKGASLGDDVTVFVKVYDSDSADLAEAEQSIAALKLAIRGSSPDSELAVRVSTSSKSPAPVRTPAPATEAAKQRRAPAPSPRADDTDDDDGFDDDFPETPSADADADADEIDPDEDEAELDAYMKSLGSAVISDRQSNTGRSRAKRKGASAGVVTTRSAQRARRVPMPKPMSADQVARAVRSGLGDPGRSRLATTRSLRRS